MWSPSETCEVRILPIGGWTAIGFLRFALGASLLFVMALHLFGSLSAALGESCFPWSCDGSLLGYA